MMENKFNLTLKQNRFLAKKNFVNMVYSNSKFEGVNTTLPQTKTIIDGMSVAGVSIDDIQVIVNLKKGLEYVMAHSEPFTVDVCKTINGIVAAEDALDPGQIRSGNVQIGGVEYVPQVPNPDEVKAFIQQIMDDDISATDKALKIMYYMMRHQIFWDGNKRTAVLSANYILINAGAGIVNINENQLETFNTLLSSYYETDDSQTIIRWTYDNCLYGIEFK
ncbi:filamentation induced by cAMP protein fic [Lentilactobacillus otakiensis DSM 19908 = JCM 15040]|uniref:Filamentation inducedby cAMP protein fic n=2 Tax=Lentilactobacillus otakiensis TaxID=481720 RepID=S4NGW6_9LACO|nr:filamentation induced by cAMP protein fic [Lentilactobacillus otakiensis DSM 19908 = JCM 15040]GAD16477.1 filamentation inducedby cAMP protein fic [Lentilactobacillus otakiensis DSM 19908 = JCM 15040]